MRIIFTLCFLLAFFAMSAQDTSGDRVLMFTASGASYSNNSSRDIAADTTLWKTTGISIGSGVNFGKWKGNRLFYYGLRFDYTSMKIDDGSSFNSLGLAPVVGLMKKIPLGGALYYMPFGEAYIAYHRLNSRSQSGEKNHSESYGAGVRAAPFSIGIQTSKKVDLLLAVGTISADYTTNKTDNNTPEVRINQFSVGAQLNTIEIRLLLRI